MAITTITTISSKEVSHGKQKKSEKEKKRE
jgi:hypothetical protein